MIFEDVDDNFVAELKISHRKMKAIIISNH